METQRITRTIIAWETDEAFEFEVGEEIAHVRLTFVDDPSQGSDRTEIAFGFERSELEDLKYQIENLLDAERPTTSVSVTVELTVQGGFGDVVDAVENELSGTLYGENDAEATVDSVYEN